RMVVGALVVAGALTAVAFGADTLVSTDGDSGGRTVEYWIAAVPVSWNIVPNGHDDADAGAGGDRAGAVGGADRRLPAVQPALDEAPRECGGPERRRAAHT